MTYDLTMERLFDASAADVFDAFTDPVAHREWYLDQPDFVVESTVELRVGGTWSTSFGPAGAEPYREINVFTVIDRPSRLVYTSTFVMPGGATFETHMVVTFTPRDGKTVMTIVQTGFPTEKDRNDHQGGWPNFLDRFEAVVAERAAA
jgi:uncharacterized protein YndB with AHSA1/START domain